MRSTRRLRQERPERVYPRDDASTVADDSYELTAELSCDGLR